MFGFILKSVVERQRDIFMTEAAAPNLINYYYILLKPSTMR